MPNHKPNTTHLKRYPKGVSGNPNGRPKLPADLKKARKLNQIEVGRIINKYMNESIEFIKEEMDTPGTSALEALLGKIIIEAHKHGDYSRVNFLFDRMIGKVTEKVEHTMPKPTVIKLLGEEAALVLGSQKSTEENE